MKGHYFLVLFGVFWTAIVGSMDAMFLDGIVRQALATDYPSVRGRVTHSEVTSHRGSKGGRIYRVKIEYGYRVGERDLQGQRFRYREVGSSDSQWAKAAVAAYPVGGETRVFYNPKDPADSLLSPGVDGGDLMVLLFMSPFNVIMLGLWATGGSLLWHGWRKTPGGGVPIRVTRWQTRVCLAEYGPLSVAAVALGYSSFFSLFVVAFGLGGFHPRLSVILVVWAVVLGIAATAGIWQWGRIRTGRYDLVFDEPGGWIEVPALDKRSSRRRVPTDKIARVEVETVVTRTSKGGTSRSYIPLLHFQPGYGDSVRLRSFVLETRAEAFAEWLRQKVGLSPTQRGPATAT